MENSRVTISDEEDDDYVPLLCATLPPRKVLLFPCYLCSPSLRFATELDVHLHIKTQHPSLYQNYSFTRRKCRICKVTLKSLSFRGLISHIVEKKCQERLAKKDAQFQRKEEFLQALSLCSVSSLSESDKQSLREQRSCESKQINKQISHQPVVNNEPVGWTGQQHGIYGAPIPEVDPACDYGRFLSQHVKRPQHSTKPTKPKVCTSFICGYRDEGVAKPCSECMHLMKAKKPIHSLPLKSAQERGHRNETLRNTQIPVTVKSAVKSSIGIEPGTRDLYNRAISARRASAIQANLKNCIKTVRKMKRFERRKERKKPLRRVSDEENNTQHDNPSRGNLVLKIGKNLWLKVLDDVQNNINTPKN